MVGAGAERLGVTTAPDLSPGAPTGATDPAKAIRRQSPTLSFAWSLTVSLLLAWQVLTRIWPAFLRGRVIVCDRYLLDARAHLAYQYGEDRSFAIQLSILRRFFPQPRAAYLLEVSSETASARKSEFTREQNQRRAEIYRRHAAELGVRVLDGERPVAELCEEIARDAWAELA